MCHQILRNEVKRNMQELIRRVFTLVRDFVAINLLIAEITEPVKTNIASFFFNWQEQDDGEPKDPDGFKAIIIVSMSFFFFGKFDSYISDGFFNRMMMTRTKAMIKKY